MPFKLGSVNISAMKLGTASISAAYIGSDQVFSSAATGPVFGEGTAKPILGFETNTIESNSATWTITVPSVTEEGDLLLLLGAARDDRFVTPPTGWEEIADVKNGGLSAVHIFYRVATSADVGGGTYTYVPLSAGTFTNTCLTIRNADIPILSTANIQTTNTPTTNSVSGFVAPSVNLYISFFGARNLGVTSLISPPSTMDTINFQWSGGALNAIAGIYESSSNNFFNPQTWSLSADADSVGVGFTIRV